MNRHQCDEFMCGYLDAALFTTDTAPPSGMDYVLSGRADEMFPRLPDYFIEQARKDCAAFTARNCGLLTKAGTPIQNGADFWFTRNGHGAGFWDRGYPEEIGDSLTKAAHAFGEVYLMPDEIGQTETA